MKHNQSSMIFFFFIWDCLLRLKPWSCFVQANNKPDVRSHFFTVLDQTWYLRYSHHWWRTSSKHFSTPQKIVWGYFSGGNRTKYQGQICKVVFLTIFRYNRVCFTFYYTYFSLFYLFIFFFVKAVSEFAIHMQHFLQYSSDTCQCYN